MCFLIERFRVILIDPMYERFVQVQPVTPRSIISNEAHIFCEHPLTKGTARQTF